MTRSWKNTIHVEQVTDEVRGDAAVGLFKAAEHVLQVSNSKVPIEEGTLERSGATSVDVANLKAAISYDTIYAPKQHEDLTLKHDAGRTAKFLENAMNSERDTVRKIIADEISSGRG